ncbi:hypothetical protein b3_0325 [Synechococcus phage B3]|nr:hypothetical protein b3_0325 [Synechococcus phage B3]QGT54931.1 hypothetical protein b23_0318 [Synechococcus phage B23]
MWTFNGKIFDEVDKKYEGFVYLITNQENGMRYVGKKHFWERRKNPKTGRRQTKESDWRNYFGSCDDLKEDVKNLGKEKFKREILYLCPHKKSMSYYETYEQFNRNVLLDETYYNTNIEGKFYSSEVDRIYNLVTEASNPLKRGPH